MFFRGIGDYLSKMLHKASVTLCTINHQGFETAMPDIFERVNEILIRRGIIYSALSPSEIQSIVDFHSPTASGKIEIDKGFDPLSFPKRYFPGYEQILLETYCHFELALEIRAFRRVDLLLRRAFPLDGMPFSVIVRKPESKPATCGEKLM